MSRLFVIQVAGISNREMLKKKKKRIIWIYFFGGTTGKETHPGWFCVCKSYLRIVLRRNWEELTCVREEPINMVMHPKFSQAEEKSCQIQALNPTPLTCACIPAAQWGGGSLAGLQEQRAEPRAAGEGLSFLHLPHSGALSFGSVRSWGVPHCSRYVPQSVWQPECFCEQSLWGT